jgi:hypothetical protein
MMRAADTPEQHQQQPRIRIKETVLISTPQLRLVRISACVDTCLPSSAWPAPAAFSLSQPHTTAQPTQPSSPRLPSSPGCTYSPQPGHPIGPDHPDRTMSQQLVACAPPSHQHRQPPPWTMIHGPLHKPLLIAVHLHRLLPCGHRQVSPLSPHHTPSRRIKPQANCSSI